METINGKNVFNSLLLTSTLSVGTPKYVELHNPADIELAVKKLYPTMTDAAAKSLSLQVQLLADVVRVVEYSFELEAENYAVSLELEYLSEVELIKEAVIDCADNGVFPSLCRTMQLYGITYEQVKSYSALRQALWALSRR